MAATANVTTVVARDICDMRATAGEIEIDLKYAGKALADAYAGERDEAEAKAAALVLLYLARDGLADLIVEVERAA